jgi:hypothetical protein
MESGMDIYARLPGNGITGVLFPEGFNSNALIRKLDEEFGVQIERDWVRYRIRRFASDMSAILRMKNWSTSPQALRPV